MCTFDLTLEQQLTPKPTPALCKFTHSTNQHVNYESMRREKEAPEHVYFYEKNYKLSTNQRAPK
jgi:hypothetical protein